MSKKTENGAAFGLRQVLESRAVTRPTETTIVYLDQAAAAEVRKCERDIAQLVKDSPAEYGKDEHRRLAEQIKAARERMHASGVTFRFQAIDKPTRQTILAELDGRSDADEAALEDERELRTYAAMCVEPVGVTWEDLRLLRDGDGENVEGIGLVIFEATVAAACDRAVGELTVPFSLPALSILSTKT